MALPPLLLPAFAMPKSYAAWPVWSDSTTKEIKFQGMPKRIAAKMFHRARQFDRQTKEKGSADDLSKIALQAKMSAYQRYAQRSFAEEIAENGRIMRLSLQSAVSKCIRKAAEFRTGR